MSKIPNNAKLIFTGEIFNVYQWPQKMFDGTMATFEMLKRPNTVQIIATEGEKIIITSEQQPGRSWKDGLLGGRQDDNETPLQCAKRELLEESGYVSSDWELIKTYEPHNKIDWKVYFYIARNCKKVAEQKLDSGEKIKIKKISFDQLITLLINKKISVGEFAFDVLKMKYKNKLDLLKNKIFKPKTRT